MQRPTRAFGELARLGFATNEGIARAMSDVAEQISHSTVSRIRNGRVKPSRRFIHGAEALTGLRYLELFPPTEAQILGHSEPVTGRSAEAEDGAAIACLGDSKRAGYAFVTEYLPVEKVPQSTDDGATS